MTKTYKIINIIFFSLICIFDAIYLATPWEAYIFKTIPSALFVFCGLYNYLYAKTVLKSNNKNLYMLLMLIGLVFACAGDIFLIDYFIFGAILFAIGHIWFFISFCTLKKINWKDLVIGLIIFSLVLCLIEFYPKFDFTDMKIIVIAYALIISLMLGKALSNLVFDKENTKCNLLIFIGALLFFISDAMLLFNVFANAPFIFDVFCLATYYPAEFILGYSISNISINYKTKNN